MNNEVKVQVVCVTYNQKDYIREALDSFLMQKTNFRFEVLIGDDCSTDGTSEIVAEYAQKYPNIIKHIRRNPNMGCLANFMDLCEKANAKYIAFCDGDDYWTDENKLQKQFDFMEENKNVNICAHKTFIKAKKNWNLYNYYSKQEEPFIIPDRNRTNISQFIKIDQIMKQWPHTSSLLVRRTIKKYPKWAKSGGPGGDMSVIFLNLGDKSMYIMDECMSIYRRIEQGVVYNSKDITEHFLNTRVNDYFRILGGTIQYFKSHYNSFAINSIESRLWTEIINYTNAVIKSNRWDKLIELKETYPNEYNKVVSLLSEYKYRLQQIDKLGVKHANLLRKNDTLMRILPLLKIIYRLKKIKNQIKSLIKIIHSFFAYWLFAIVPKKKNLWVFSNFNKKNYMDNTKYLFEYIVKKHPEIEAVWITKDKAVRKYLKENKLPVHRMTSLLGIWTTARASVAFSDHFKITDYDNRYGFNARTKFVNLWHGVGLKNMIPKGDTIPNTNTPGVRLSSDIIINEKDNIISKFIKFIKYPFVAPFRELFENYYGLVCVGEPFVGFFAEHLRVKKSSQMLVGYPRHINLYKSSEEKSFNIIYAPTYRWDKNREKYMIETFVNNIDEINGLLESIDGKFILRLHPHTWRNYENLLSDAINKYSRFSISKEKDIYENLNSYSLLITDYSSIGYDFLITQKPIIYFAFDLEDYKSNDCSLSLSYEENSAGDIVYNWQEAINSIKKSYNNPEYNRDLRLQILNKFFPASYNSKDNSKQIINELKNRLNIKE